jgi:D-arabinose 1-dehydrogenase-like Zn-dependent alcohol dehydrogenase
MWNERYGKAEYAFGTHPNDFLVSVASQIPQGKILCLGESEGRNAVYLASLGYEVVAIDQSEVGLAKADKLAAQQDIDGLVSLETVKAKLTGLDWKTAQEVDRAVIEGSYHNGMAAVVQILGEAH